MDRMAKMARYRAEVPEGIRTPMRSPAPRPACVNSSGLAADRRQQFVIAEGSCAVVQGCGIRVKPGRGLQNLPQGPRFRCQVHCRAFGRQMRLPAAGGNGGLELGDVHWDMVHPPTVPQQDEQQLNGQATE